MEKHSIAHLKNNRKFIATIKIMACLIVVTLVIQVFYGEGLDSYYTEKVYDYQNDLGSNEISSIDLSTPIRQEFLSKGQTLTSVRIYISELSNAEAVLNIALLSSDGNEILCSSVNAADLAASQWNSIEMNASGLKRGSTYTLEIYTTDGETGIVSGAAENTDNENYLTLCTVDGGEIYGCLAVGIHQICRYMTLPYALCLGTDILLLGGGRCAYPLCHSAY